MQQTMYLPTMEQKSMNLWKYCRDLDRSDIRSRNLRQCNMDRFERSIINTRRSLDIMENIYLTLQQKKYILHHNANESMPTSVKIDEDIVPEYSVNIHDKSSTFDPATSTPPEVQFSKVQNSGGAAVLSQESDYLTQLLQNLLDPLYKRLDDIEEKLKEKTEDVKEDAKNAVKSVINTVQEIVNPPEPIIVEDTSVVEPVKESLVSKATSVFKPVEREKKTFMHEMHVAADECVKDLQSGKHGDVEEIEYIVKSAELIRDWIGYRFSKDNISVTGFDVKNFPLWMIGWISYFSKSITDEKFYIDKDESCAYMQTRKWLSEVKNKQCKYNIPREIYLYCNDVETFQVTDRYQFIFDKLIRIILPYFEPIFMSHSKLILGIDKSDLQEFTSKWSFSTSWTAFYYVARIIHLKDSDQLTSTISINDILSGEKLDDMVWFYGCEDAWNDDIKFYNEPNYKGRYLNLLHR